MIVRLRALILIVVILLGAAAVNGQDVPSTMSVALQQLSSLVGYPVTLQMLDAYSWESNNYPDTHLGCELAVFPAVTGNYFGYHFTLTLNAVAYDIRVSGDGSIVFPCIGDGGTSPLPGVTSVPGVPAAELAPCPAGYEGYLRPRLRVGGQGSIEAGGTPNRIRSSPSVLAPQIGVIQPGSTVTVLAGPSCEPQSVNGQANIIFWQVNAGGVIGWTAEGLLPDDYFIEAIGGSAGGSLPTERTVISPENAAAFNMLTTVDVVGVADMDIAPRAMANFGLLLTAGEGDAVGFDLSTWGSAENLTQYRGATAVAISDDGTYAAFGFCEGRFSMLNRTTSQSVTLQFPGGGCVTDLDYSSAPDPILVIGLTLENGSGQLALVRSSAPAQSAVFYNIATVEAVTAVAFNPDGSTFAYLDDQLHVLNTDTQATLNAIPMDALNPVGALGFVPLTALAAPQVVAVGEGSVVRVINLSQSNEMRFDLEEGNYAAGIAFSADARIMAVISSPVISSPATAPELNLFDLQTGDMITGSFLPAESSAVAFSTDGTVLITTSIGQLILWGIP